MPDKRAFLAKIPFPPAVLVIDTRHTSASYSYILNTLRYETETLYQETHMEDVNQWRYLTSIIDFLSLGPMSQEELELYREPYKSHASQGTQASQSKKERYGSSLTGRVDTKPTRHYGFFNGAPQQEHFDDLPTGSFKEHLREILSICDVLRTKRVNATTDIGFRGRLENTRADGMVRIIFIADAQNDDSLATAATYAAYLRKNMLYQNAHEEQLLLSTMVVCVNHDNRGEAPRRLIDALSWENDDSWPHIDSCVLVEKYGELSARMNDAAQEEHIELLLYALMITDPYQLRIDMPPPDVSALLEQGSLYRRLPTEKCYAIGLSAFTYGVRWGRSLLNSTLAECITQELTTNPQHLSSVSTKQAINDWLDEQQATVESAVPEQVTHVMPDLNALTQAEAVARSAKEVFRARSLSINVGKRALVTLDNYASELEATYTSSNAAQMSLQKAVQYEPSIAEFVRRWPENSSSPLMTVLTNAQRVLVHSSFFAGTKGAIPRARHQLQEIAQSVGERENAHKGQTVNPEQQRDALHKRSETERQALEALNAQFPFLGSHARGFMQIGTLILWLIVVFVASLAGLAWLHHVVLHAAPLIDLFDQELFGSSVLTIFNLLVVLIVASFVGLTALICSRVFLGGRGSPLKIEIALLISLLIFTLFGGIVSLSLVRLVDDTIALGLIAWLAVLPYISVVTGLILLVLLLCEVLYFVKWHRDIVRAHAQSIKALREQHLHNVQQVRHYLAEAFLLALLQRADLVDEKRTGRGRYYTAIDQLHTLLGTVQQRAETQHQTIERHLDRITESGPKTSKLYLREELLELPAIKSRLATLLAGIHTNASFEMFVQLLLRVTGVEAPLMIVRDIEEHPRATSTLVQMDGHREQLLLSTTAALALELSLAQRPLTPPDFEALKDRFAELNQQHQHELLENLLGQTKTRFANHKGGETNVELAIAATHAWVSLLWEQDEILKELLTAEGVLTHMERKKYLPETIRDKFNIRTAPTSRSMHAGQQTGTYLFISPTERDSELLRKLSELSLTRNFIGFPDEELFALLSITRYVAMPYKVEVVPTPAIGPAQSNGNGAIASS